jgi:hypothetical protein
MPDRASYIWVLEQREYEVKLFSVELVKIALYGLGILFSCAAKLDKSGPQVGKTLYAELHKKQWKFL